VIKGIIAKGEMIVDIEQTIFTIITYSGEAKNLFMKAIKAAKLDEFNLAQDYITEADEKLTAAHKEQTELIRREARGEKVDPSILLIHGQDHLMSAMLLKEMSQEIIELYIRLKKK